MVETGLERGLFLCPLQAVADVEGVEVVGVGCASEVGVGEEALAFRGEEGGEIGGWVEGSLNSLEEGRALFSSTQAWGVVSWSLFAWLLNYGGDC